MLERWASTRTGRRVVFVGRITRQKGLPLPARGRPILPPGVQLVVLAGAPDTPEIEAEVSGWSTSCARRATASCGSAACSPGRTWSPCSPHATVFACPSIYEPLGIVNLEAMACETAVVATATGGIPEVVARWRRPGLLVPIDQASDGTGTPLDPDHFVADFAAALNELVDDPGPAAGLGKAGRQRAIEHFCWAAIAERTLEVYRSVLCRYWIAMTGRLWISDVTPRPAGGEHPAKAVVGELTPISAAAFREGHDVIGCQVNWRGPDGAAHPVVRMTQVPGTDGWTATIRPDAVGMWTFTVSAFADQYLTWRSSMMKKMEAGQGPRELANDLASGAAILDRATDLVPADRVAEVKEAAAALRDKTLPIAGRAYPALDLTELMWTNPVQELVTTTKPARIWVDRKRALFSAWYEFFPRSEGATVDRQGRPIVHGTFATAAQRLPGVAAMGFDVVYLPPIHPIGKVNRKGRNNALVARPEDVGSPWAIGSAEGGHDAVHPKLGTVDDFRAFVKRARADGPRGGLGSRPAVRPRPSLGHQASGVVHHTARRHDRLRREPAQEVSGHLPA